VKSGQTHSKQTIYVCWSLFYENENMPHACRYDHQIRHKKLSIKSLKNQLSIFLDKKIHCSNLFYFFLKTSFLCKAPNCDTGNYPLTSSDRAEIFTTDTWKYPPEVESAVLISHVSIRIYRVLNLKKLVLAKTFTYFFY
jgi:hypothetical protein